MKTMIRGWLVSCAATLLVLVFPGRARTAGTGKAIPEANTPSQAGPFDAWIEQAAKNPPSEELPVDQAIAIQVNTACRQIGLAAVGRLKATPYKSASVRVRSICYVIDEGVLSVMGTGAPHIRVDYAAKADTRDTRSEFIFCGVQMVILDGRLVRFPDSWRQISPFADVLEPILKTETDSVLKSISALKSITYSQPLSWAKGEQARRTVSDGSTRLLALYVQCLTDFLESQDTIKGRIRAISYEHWFEEPPEPNVARIRVTFDVTGTPDRFLWPSVELDYKDGKYRLRDIPPSSRSGGTEYVADASNSAMDCATEEWVKGFTADGPFKDARVGPPFPWRENPKELPEGIGRVVHLTQRSHPFLGEHNRRLRIELADGRKRVFTLPADGGDVSRTDILLIRHERKLFVRVKDDSMTNFVVALDSLKICSPGELPQGEIVLTFPE